MQNNFPALIHRNGIKLWKTTPETSKTAGLQGFFIELTCGKLFSLVFAAKIFPFFLFLHKMRGISYLVQNYVFTKNQKYVILLDSII